MIGIWLLYNSYSPEVIIILIIIIWMVALYCYLFLSIVFTYLHLNYINTPTHIWHAAWVKGSTVLLKMICSLICTGGYVCVLLNCIMNIGQFWFNLQLCFILGNVNWIVFLSDVL